MSTTKMPLDEPASLSVEENATVTDEHLALTADAGGSGIALQPNLTCYCR